MAYRIRYSHRDHVAGEVRRMAREKLKSVRRSLGKGKLGGDPETLAETVHEVRKDLKKLRALIRLVRPVVGEKVYQRENKAYRNAGRALAPLRDGWVKWQRVRRLLEEQRQDEGGDAEVEQLLAKAEERLRERYEREASEKRVRKAMSKARACLKGARGRVSEWPLEEAQGFALCRGGLRKVYGRGRKAFAQAASEVTADHLHEWRKRCKYLRYHLRLLRMVWPEMLELTEKTLHELTDLLGDDHDLAVVRQTLEEALSEEMDERMVVRVNVLLEARHRERVQACWSSGRRLFAEKPKAFVYRLEGYWPASPLKS